MPELPEVEAARKFAETVLVGRRMVEVETVEDSIVYDAVGRRRLAGRCGDAGSIRVRAARQASVV